jgi:hypothetical protein
VNDPGNASVRMGDLADGARDGRSGQGEHGAGEPR